MASMFSVSRLIGKSRNRSIKHSAKVDSIPSVVIVSSEDEASKTNSRPEILPKEKDFSFPPTSFRKGERKTDALEEPGYDVVLQPSAKVSFGEWTELDTGKKANGPAEEAFDAEHAQFGSHKNTREEPSLANDTNWIPLDMEEKVEEPPRVPSVPDWIHLETDKKTEEPPANPPPDLEWLQLDTGKTTKEERGVAVLSVEENEGITLETHVKEERKAHMEEMVIVKEEKAKLAERVKELEEELQQAEKELQLKMEQISKIVIDLEWKRQEIEELKEGKERIQQLAAREKQESLDELRRSNEAMRQAAKELKDAEREEILREQDGMQDELANVIGELSKSRTRVAELKSTNELQAQRISEQDATLASNNDTIAVLKGQKASLIAQVHTLRTNVKVNERQNSMLMVQLRQQSDDLASRETTQSPKISVRRTTGSTLVEQAVRTIKALNDEIYQTAASLTDYVEEIEKRFVEESDGTATALETLKSLLGTEIYTELEDSGRMTKEEYNPFILQTGFQVCLTACCMRIITSWCPTEPEYGKFLEAVYERIRGLGGAENAAQWRKWTLRSCSFSTTGAKSVLFDFVIDNLYAMLSMSGWPKLGNTANLLDQFSGKISEIVDLAVRLNTLAAETPLPGDLQATTIEKGIDYVPQEMTNDTPEDEEDDTDCDTAYSQVVVGCVGLGLKWREYNMYKAQLVLKPRVIVRKVYRPHW